MATPESVNSQITDAVTQTNTKVLGDAPAASMGALYQAVCGAEAIAAQNAASAPTQSDDGISPAAAIH